MLLHALKGRKKGDKFDATKAAIESVRDTATGSFDVDEALDALEVGKELQWTIAANIELPIPTPNRVNIICRPTKVSKGNGSG